MILTESKLFRDIMHVKISVSRLNMTFSKSLQKAGRIDIGL